MRLSLCVYCFPFFKSQLLTKKKLSQCICICLCLCIFVGHYSSPHHSDQMSLKGTSISTWENRFWRTWIWTSWWSRWCRWGWGSKWRRIAQLARFGKDAFSRRLERWGKLAWKYLFALCALHNLFYLHPLNVKCGKLEGGNPSDIYEGEKKNNISTPIFRTWISCQGWSTMCLRPWASSPWTSRNTWWKLWRRIRRRRRRRGTGDSFRKFLNEKLHGQKSRFYWIVFHGFPVLSIVSIERQMWLVLVFAHFI